MNVKKEPAVCFGDPPEQTASNNQLLKQYRKAMPLSTLKLGIGELLLFGNKKQKVFWPFFNAILRQYIDLRMVSQSGTEQPGSTIK